MKRIFVNLDGAVSRDILAEKDWILGNQSSTAEKRRRAFDYASGVAKWVRVAVHNTRNPNTGVISLRKVAKFLNNFQPEGFPILSQEGKPFAATTVSRLLYETETKNTGWVEFEFEREIARLGDKLTPEIRKKLEAKRDELIQRGVELGRYMRMDDAPVRKPDPLW
ncbi:hypothetical protein [Sphingomonas xinjiangensis]|uniref:Uncharacterized protein n=1 Tax=Sphingomonas xinjiangensis TaxID=643568 RepID=A0A840YPE8_9SPHN|nr:hypothetical protein [Sphingomonas xinjiangensis]MBB5709692.1 hypothetical protein [Sphingomonas xinjiangensis]